MDELIPIYFPRKCDKCNRGMVVGWYAEGYTYEYLCSTECLDKVMPLLTYVEMYHNDAVYWTDWIDSDPEYVQIGNKTMRIEEFNAKNNKQ